jgi:uncharacterized protein YktB (UPF0637 family)
METRHFKLNHCHIQNYTALSEVKNEFKGCITINGNDDTELEKDLEKKAKRFASLVSDDFGISVFHVKDNTQLKAMIFYYDNEIDEYTEAKNELEEKKAKRASRQIVRSQKR